MSEVKASVCEHCGAPVRAGSTACGYCGIALNATSTPAKAGSASHANPADAEIESYLRNDDLISAIRVYKSSRKCSLLEAKTACEAWKQRIGR